MLDLDDIARLELLPCPFCGGTAALTRDEDYPHRWSVACTGCCMGDDGYKAAAWAAEEWNKRTVTARNYEALLHAVAAVVNCTSVDAENAALEALSKVYTQQTGTVAASGLGYAKPAPMPDQTDVINAALIGNEG
jgi:hypothetical protein